MDTKRIKHKITRLHTRCNILLERYKDTTIPITDYHTNRELGYIRGQLTILEELVT